MIHLRNTLARAASTAVVAIASLFDRGLDGLVSTFTRLDQQLEAYIARKGRMIDAETEARANSYVRQQTAATAEASLRFQSVRRQDAHEAELVRAERIRAKIADLIG